MVAEAVDEGIGPPEDEDVEWLTTRAQSEWQLNGEKQGSGRTQKINCSPRRLNISSEIKTASPTLQVAILHRLGLTYSDF